MREFLFHGEPTPKLKEFLEGLKEALQRRGYLFHPEAEAPQLVLNAITPESPRPYRRRAQATFVASTMELSRFPENPVQSLYLYLVRALSNVLMVYVPSEGVKFLTLELGHYNELAGDGFFERVAHRLAPLADSRLVINNVFEPDLEPELWQGDEKTESMYRAGKKLKAWDLLPAPFPIEEILPPEDLRHVRRLYGIGGLSYGNLSVRKDERRFWMSASGVDKANLREIGREILMVKDYDPIKNAIVLSVPPHTIMGHSLDEIMERIEGRLIRTVPMI